MFDAQLADDGTISSGLGDIKVKRDWTDPNSALTAYNIYLAICSGYHKSEFLPVKRKAIHYPGDTDPSEGISIDFYKSSQDSEEIPVKGVLGKESG